MRESRLPQEERMADPEQAERCGGRRIPVSPPESLSQVVGRTSYGVSVRCVNRTTCDLRRTTVLERCESG